MPKVEGVSLYVWTYDFYGSYLGGTVVVIAGTSITAKKHAKIEIEKLGYDWDDSNVELISKRKVKPGTIAYSWDGDY